MFLKQIIDLRSKIEILKKSFFINSRVKPRRCFKTIFRLLLVERMNVRNERTKKKRKERTVFQGKRIINDTGQEEVDIQAYTVL